MNSYIFTALFQTVTTLLMTLCYLSVEILLLLLNVYTLQTVSIHCQ
jgi:hypothetical protein